MRVIASADVETAVNVAMKSFTQAMATMTIAGKRVHYPVRLAEEGVRRTRYSTGGIFDIDAGTALRDIPPSSIQLMEVYGGVARLPGEYLDDACAVILIWLK